MVTLVRRWFFSTYLVTYLLNLTMQCLNKWVYQRSAQFICNAKISVNFNYQSEKSEFLILSMMILEQKR